MKSKIVDLYRHVGDSIIIAGTDIADGTYVIMSTGNPGGFELYNIATQRIEQSELNDITEVTRLTTDLSLNLELLEESFIKKVLSMTNIGSTLDSEGYSDIKPYIEKINVIQTLIQTREAGIIDQ